MMDFITDTATLAIFDPAVIKSRIHNNPDWWVNFVEVVEYVTGKITLVGLSGDGIYGVNVTDTGLSEDEKHWAIEIIEGQGVEVASEKLFIGSGESLCIADPQIEPRENDGCFINIDNGLYDLTIYGISPDEQSKKIADIVIHIAKRTKPFSQLDNESTLFSMTHKGYLYSKPPKIKLGIKLQGKVWKTPRTASGLVIKDNNYSWPNSYSDYDILLENMSQVKRGDIVEFETTSIDQENKIISATMISIPENKSA